MVFDELNKKDRIFKSTLELIESNESIENITARQIAKKANVNLALINYYFKSKDNLMAQVTQYKMNSIISMMDEKEKLDILPLDKLKKMLISTADLSFKFNKIFKIAISEELKNGCQNSCELVIPYLQKILTDKSINDLRIVALQLMLPFHEIVLYPEVYGKLLETDFFNDGERAYMISKIVDSIVNTQTNGVDVCYVQKEK